ncbi:MAG: hypothetical protein IIY78_05650 [Clostridia bacterium]|nr:hypothetical protein [Clostridia bacterium]
MDISCELVRDLADVYLTGNASADTVNTVDEHLTGCDDCAKYYAKHKPHKSPMLKVEFSEPEEEQIAMNLSRLSKRLRMRRTIGTALTVVTAIFGLSALLYDIMDDNSKKH